MEILSGRATLVRGDEQIHCTVQFRASTGILEVEFPTEAMVFDGMMNEGITEAEFELRDVNIALPTGTLTSESITDIYRGNGLSSRASISATPLTMALNLSGDRSGTTTLPLHTRFPTIEFEHQPALVEGCELYYLNSPLDFMSFNVTLLGEEVAVFPRKGSLSFRGSEEILGLEHRLRLAWSFLQGTPLWRSAHAVGNQVTIYVRKPRPPGRKRSLYSGHQNLEPMFQSMVSALGEMEVAEFAEWAWVSTFYLEGRNTDLDDSVRATSFFVFMEMFDESQTMNQNSISKQFQCSHQLADILVRLRNRIVHGRQNLWDAVPAAYEEIISKYSDWTCPELEPIQFTDDTCGSTLLLLIEQIVSRFVLFRLGYTGSFADNQALIDP